MAKLFIVHPSGVKTEVSREQLVDMARAGQITPETKLDAIGRIISASKIRELNEIFAERNATSSSSSTTVCPTGVPVVNEADAPPTQGYSNASRGAYDSAEPFFSPSRSPSVGAVPQYDGADQAKVRRIVTRLVRDDANPNDTVAQRARARTKSMTAPFSLCRTLCLCLGGFAVVGCVMRFVFKAFQTMTHSYLTFGEKFKDIFLELFACLGLIIAASFVYYVLWGIFNYIVQYARQRAEDSVRREDFYSKALQLLEETANKAE